MVSLPQDEKGFPQPAGKRAPLRALGNSPFHTHGTAGEGSLYADTRGSSTLEGRS